MPSVHQAGLLPKTNEKLPGQGAQLMRPEFVLLAEVMKTAGYTTTWSLSNTVAGEQYGFARGVDHYFDFNGVAAHDQVFEALSWLKESRDSQPFFLFVHTLDPHYPYSPPKEFYAAVHGESVETRLAGLPEQDRKLCTTYVEEVESVREGRHSRLMHALGQEGRAFIRALYMAEIRYVDRQFERLLGFLRRTELLDDTVVIFISDHGEAFGEHDLFYHQQIPYAHQTHVPLLVRMPGQTAQRRVPHSVALYDLYPTLIELARQTPPSYVQAETLFSADGVLQADRHRTVYSACDHHTDDSGSWSYGVTEGANKLLVNPSRKLLSAFDLARDPGETQNLLENGGGYSPVESLHAQHLAQCDENARLAATFGPPALVEMDSKGLDELEALGYL
jgi:arylsulfatase A-like enzyme